MKILKLNPKKNKAQAMVEFAIALPVLLLIVYGLIETGRYLFVSISVNNAARQAVRYGSTSGIGPNGVERYRDCDGIRAAAENSDILNAFDAYNAAYFVIEYDNGPGTTSYAGCTGSTATVSPVTGDRVTVTVNAEFHALLPRFLPFLSRTLASNPLVAVSSRTLLLTIEIQDLVPTKTEITSDQPDDSDPGEWVTVVVKVTADDGTTPTGLVTIIGQDEGCDTPQTLSGGTVTCQIRFNTPGDKYIDAVYSGDSGYEASSDKEPHSVKVDSITTVSTSPNPSQVSDTVTVKVKVKSVGGDPAADGTQVEITGSDGINCIITLGQGTLSGTGEGTCEVNFTSVAVKSVTANFSGNAELRLSSDTIIHDVLAPAETRVRFLSDSPDPSEMNQLVTVNIAVIALTNVSTPTGTVTLTGADEVNCPAYNGGLLTCTVRFYTLGNKILSAEFISTNGYHQNNTGTESHSVELAKTTTSITSILNEPSQSGETVTVTVSVTGGSSAPTGTVTITGGDTPCTITLPATSCTTKFTTAISGTKTVTATYSGDSLHAGSSDTASHSVIAAAITGCDTITPSLLKFVNGALVMDITNPLSTPVQIGSIAFKWYADKGHGSGNEKRLFLQNVSLGSTTIWSDNVIHQDPFGVIPGDNSGNILFNPPAGTLIPGNNATTSLTFTYQQSQDRWLGDYVQVNLSTPGCELTPITQDQHVK